MEFDLLFSAGEPTLGAFRVESGTIQIDMGWGCSFEIKAQKTILGAHEYLLHPDEGRAVPRMFSISVSEDADIKQIEFLHIDELFRDYNFGFFSNRFFAEVLDKSNAAYVKQLKGVPDELKKYGSDAALYAQLLLEMKIISRQMGVPELRELYDRFRPDALYQRGLLQQQQTRFATLDLESIEMTRFVDEFAAETTICKEGEAAEDLFVLLRGSLSVWKKEKRIAEIGLPGEAFGEMALFLGRNRTASVIADVKAAIYKIPLNELREFHASHPKVFLQIARTLAEREVLLLEEFDKLMNLSTDKKHAEELYLKGRKQLKELIGAIHVVAREKKAPQVLAHLFGAREFEGL